RNGSQTDVSGIEELQAAVDHPGGAHGGGGPRSWRRIRRQRRALLGSADRQDARGPRHRPEPGQLQERRNARGPGHRPEPGQRQGQRAGRQQPQQAEQADRLLELSHPSVWSGAHPCAAPLFCAPRTCGPGRSATEFRLGWGAVSGSLDSAVSLVGGWVDEGVIPGAALLVSRGDEVLVERYWGVADMSRKVPASANTLWSIASITKPVTAATFMACVDRGLLSLDAPLSGVLPEFARDGDKRPWRRHVP